MTAMASQITGEFHAQKASNAENVSIWGRHCESNFQQVYPPAMFWDWRRMFANLHIFIAFLLDFNTERFEKVVAILPTFLREASIFD